MILTFWVYSLIPRITRDMRVNVEEVKRISIEIIPIPFLKRTRGLEALRKETHVKSRKWEVKENQAFAVGKHLKVKVFISMQIM